jgi:hypothetical protein
VRLENCVQLCPFLYGNRAQCAVRNVYGSTVPVQVVLTHVVSKSSREGFLVIHVRVCTSGG